MEQQGILKEGGLGFVGCGQMASAIILGLKKAGMKPERMMCMDVDVRRMEFVKGLGCKASGLKEIAACRVVLICVKPNQVKGVCSNLKKHISGKGPLIISIAAGTTLVEIESVLSTERVVRVMPNVNCLVQQAAQAYCLGSKCSKADGKMVEDILGVMGTIDQVATEKLMNAVTGLSGSGPAYVYQFIEALADGGVRSGLPRPLAIKLACQTVLGSAQNVKTNLTQYHSAQLKDFVCSPAGTTITGVHELEKGGMRAAVMNAVLAATRRSEELGQLKSKL